MKKSPRPAPRLDLNPSSADRWTTCTASPQFILDNWDKVPSQDSKYNLEGTTAHEVAAAELEGRKPNPAECPTPISPDMRWHAWNYAEYVNELREAGSVLIVEKKFPLWYMPARNAKIDAAVVRYDAIHIVDYKYGEGIPVSPNENLQGAIYARSIIEDRDGHNFPFDYPVFIHIYQPRGRTSVDSPAHVWETQWGELNRFTDTLISQPAALIQQPELFSKVSKVQFRPSEKACQWCPAKGFCKARMEGLTTGVDALTEFERLDPIKPFDSKSVLDRVAMDWIKGEKNLIGYSDEVLQRAGELNELNHGKARGLPVVNTITFDQIAAILTHKKQITKWLEDAEEYAQAEMLQGKEIPGFKLVLSRGGNRYWINPQAAAKALLATSLLRKEEVIEEKVASPAAVEKLLGDLPVDIESLIAKNPGSPCIAPVGDKREQYLPVKAETEFEAITEELPEVRLIRLSDDDFGGYGEPGPGKPRDD